MAFKKQSTPKRWRSKEAKEIVGDRRGRAAQAGKRSALRAGT